jgi:prolyl-tRNA editing enzyme YbaK/EbsC (Cys-tRNA(Pro) deacylase)
MKTVTERLESLEIQYTVKPHARAVFTSEDAAVERGVRLAQIVKTMLLVDPQGNVVVAVLPGDKKLDVKKVKKLTGLKDLRFMDNESIERRLGLVTGAIAPVGELFGGCPMFVDPAVFAEAVVDISSGDPRAGLELNREDLRRLLKEATVAQIAKAEPV